MVSAAHGPTGVRVWVAGFRVTETAQEWSWHTLIGYKFKYFSKRQIFFVLATRIYDYLVNF